MLLATTGLLTPTLTQEVNIELRIYENKNANINKLKSDELEAVANSVKSWLANPTKVNINGSGEPLPDTTINNNIDPNRVTVKVIDLDREIQGETRSPSSQAWAMARHLTNIDIMPQIQTITAAAEIADQNGQNVKADALQSSADFLLAKQEVGMLTQTIIDVWITFDTPTNIVSETSKKQ